MKNKTLKNIFIALVFIFLFLPIIILVIYSFNTSKMNIIFEGFTFEWYKTMLTNTDLLEAFANTLIIAITSTIASTIIGTIGAVGLYKYNFPFKGLINKLIYIPIVIPEIVLGISLLSIYTLMKLELGMPTLILSHIAFSIPFVIVSVRSNLSPLITTYEEAAQDLGANPLNTFFKVTLPAIMPGVISGATLSFTLSLDDVVISYFTAGPGSNTLPLKIYSMIKTGITPDVNALSTIMLLVTTAIITVSAIYQSRNIAEGGKS
ncbi:MAG: ABC transporter permease subunit [Bacilli bacterium]|nr:ABC transporter permease subunit [Bacilli bacterium]